MDWASGLIRLKQRKPFEPFLCHSNERVRKLAQEMRAIDQLVRQSFCDADDETMATTAPASENVRVAPEQARWGKILDDNDLPPGCGVLRLNQTQ